MSIIISDDLHAFLFDKPLDDSLSLHKEWSRDLESFCLKGLYGEYYKRYRNDLYPHFKTYGKTRSLVFHAKRESTDPLDRCELALVDDSESFVRHSLDGVNVCGEAMDINVSMKAILWEPGVPYDAYREDFDKLHAQKPFTIESPRSVTTCLDMIKAAEMTKKVEVSASV